MEIKVSLIIWLLFSGYILIGNNRIDSLEAQLSTELPDSVKAYAYTQVIWAYQSKNPDHALKLTDDYMSLAKRNSNKDWARRANYYYTVVYKQSGQYELALQASKKVIAYSRSVNDTTWLANVSYQIGVIEKKMANYQDAIETFNKTIELYAHLEDKRMIATTRDAKAGAYKSLKLFDKADAEYLEAIKINEERKDTSALAYNYTNLANSYAERKLLDKAIAYYDITIELCERRENKWLLGFLYENKGRALSQLDKYDAAITNLKKSEDIRREFDNMTVLTPTLLQLGLTYSKIGNLSLSRKYLDEGSSFAIKMENDFYLREAYISLSNLEYKSKNYKKAYEYQKKFKQLNDSIVNSEISEKALRIDELTKYENIQKEQKIELLTANNEIKDLQIQRSQRNILILTLITLTLGLISYLVYQSRNNIRKLNSQLRIQKEVINKALVEKEFLLKEIHHRVKNNLQVISSLLKLQSRSVTDEIAKNALDEGRNRVRSMALIHKNLYQDENNLSAIPIKAYVEQLTSELIDTYQLLAENLELELDIDDLLLDVDTLVPIGLIINELVSNSIKYAFPDQASGKIKIICGMKDSDLFLQVSDNGSGYDPNAVGNQSFGLKLIRAFSDRLKAEQSYDNNNGSSSSFIIREYKLAG